MEAIIKETYEENFGTAYETYKQSVKKRQLYKTSRYHLNKRGDTQVKSKPKHIISLCLLVLNLNLKSTSWVWNQKMLLLIPGIFCCGLKYQN